MRITLDLDRAVLEAAQRLAERRSQSIGEVVSQLIRAGLRDDASRPPATAGDGLAEPAGADASAEAAPIDFEDVPLPGRKA